jgi:thiamine transport system ATP-binding protein
MLDIEDLSAAYDEGPDVLADVNLDVRAGEVVALLGPSGSGKSTLLRCVAGLHPLRSGRVHIGGTDMAAVAVERRRTGLVFQDHALFPHRDVAGNVGFGPRMQGADDAEVARRVTAALEAVRMRHLRDRRVDELSGGEQQRVALARAVASDPRLLLLDEPYGSLDRLLRDRMLAELPTLVRDLGAAALLVTHDQEDALAVADRVAVLIDGRLRQFDTPEVLWTRPADVDVARFLDVGLLLDATVADEVGTSVLGALPAPGVPSGPATLLLPRALLRLAAAGEVTSGPDGITLAGRIVEVRFAGDHELVTVALAPTGASAEAPLVRLRRLTGAPSPEARPGPGEPVGVTLPADAPRWFDRGVTQR